MKSKQTVRVLAACLILMAAPALANTTSFWSQAGIPQFYKGKFKGTALTDDGRIVLGMKTDKIFSPTEPYLWSLTFGRNGELWAGSGNKAILYRIDSKTGESVESAVLPGTGISSIAVDKKNNVYAALFPGGEIYIVRPGKKAERFTQVPAMYVWDMKFGPDGGLFCVTGMPAAAFKILPSGQPRPLYSSISEKHFLTMFLDGDRYLYAGTSPNGLVLRVNIEEALKDASMKSASKPDMRARTEEGPVIAKFVDGEKDAVNATSTGAGDDLSSANQVFPDSSSEEVETQPDPRVTVIVDLDEDEAYRMIPWENGKMLVAANSEQVPPQPPQQGGRRTTQRQEPLSFPIISQGPQPSQTLRPAKMYLVEPSGQTRKVLEIPDPFILSLQSLGNGKVIIGTGNDGRIYTLDVAADSGTLQEIAAKQVLAIAGNGSDLRIATGNPGAVFAPRNVREQRGFFTSNINDASTPAVYGSLDAVAAVPKKSSLEFRTRTGNTPDPTDGTWSGWSEPEGRWPFKITSPPGRYVQFETMLLPSPDDKSPELREVKIYYQTANQPPRIDSVTVLPAPRMRMPTGQPSMSPQGGPQSGSQMPQNQNSAQAGRQNQPQAQSDSNYIVGTVAAADDVTVRWSAFDPDQDTLRYTLHFRLLPTDTWTLLEEKLYDSDYRWKTDSVPDGRYELRVTASDIESNSQERALSEEYITDPITIDHSRPMVIIADLKKDTAGYSVSGSATDGTSVIAKIEYSIDKVEWKLIMPEDGLYDTSSEKFKFSFYVTGPGAHSLFIRATDAVGNIGSIARDF